MKRWASRCFLASLIVLAFMATAWGHGGGLNSAGCHNETATGGYHCHRSGGGSSSGGSGSSSRGSSSSGVGSSSSGVGSSARGNSDSEEQAVSLNFLAGIRPAPSGDFNLVALGLVGARRAPIVDRPEDDMHWRVNYGGVAGIQFRRFLFGVRWTPEGLGIFVGIGGGRGAGYLFGGDDLGGVGGFVDLREAPMTLGGDLGIGGKAFGK